VEVVMNIPVFVLKFWQMAIETPDTEYYCVCCGVLC